MSEPVECYSSYEYGVRPVALRWQDARLEVEAILNSWRDPRGKGFRVRTVDEKVFDLFYDIVNNSWELIEIG